MSSIPRTVLLACATTAFALSGCGGGTSTVAGKVLFEGKPVVWGSVTFVDAQGQFHQGPIGLDGTYRIENVPVGPVTIGVFSPPPPDETPQKVSAPRVPGIEDPRAKFKQNRPSVPAPPKGAWLALPESAADPASSGLTGEIVSGTTNLDINVR